MKKLIIILACFVSGVAWADWKGETRMGYGVVSVDKLKLNKPVVTLVQDGETYRVDSAAIVDAPADKIFKVSLDYGYYADFAPYVEESHIVHTQDHDGRAPIDNYYVWTKMKYSAKVWGIKKSVISKYYLHAQPLQGVIWPRDYAIRWVLAKKRHGWKFPTESYFSVLDGSWYILPLDEHRTYVRYFAKFTTDTWIPDYIISKALKSSLKPGVRDLILAIRKRAIQER